REQIILPEIDYEKVDRVRGLDITITTTAKSHAEGRALLAAFDFPSPKQGTVYEMAKQSMQAREVKRVTLADKYLAKR
ncbi:hypothetical protein CH228_28215, partial [Salmonella enterica subsp. enterica serovar Heidelberg]